MPHSIAIERVQLKTTPFDEISISEIVKIAGVGRSSFYRNFESKKHVLSYYIHQLYSDFFKNNNTMHFLQTNDNPNSFLMPRFKFVKQHKDLFCILLKQDLLYIVFEQMESGLILQLTGHPTCLSKYYRAMFSGSCAGIIRMWIDNNFAETEEEMVQIFANFPK